MYFDSMTERCPGCDGHWRCDCEYGEDDYYGEDNNDLESPVAPRTEYGDLQTSFVFGGEKGAKTT